MAVTWTLLGSGTTGGSPTSSGTSTSGARFAVAVAWDAGQTITSVVDSKGNSYSAVGTPQADGQGGLCQWYFSAGGSAGASHTATVSFSGSAFPSISFYQITDGASSAHSGSAQGQDSGGQPFVLTSGTMPSGNWSAGAICSNNTGSDGAYSANASTPTFTLLHSEGTVSSFWTHGVSWTSSSGTGAVTPSFNRSGTAGSTSGMAILVIEESIAGGGPAITTTSSATPVPGDSLTITGTDFQASQGAGYVTLGGVTQTVTSWADTSITITVVRGTAKYGSQNIVVRDNGGSDSSGYAVTLTPPTGWGYVDLASVNSTAAWRIITRPDLAIGDQIAYQTAGGLVVANDGTFSWTFGAIRSFDAEVWTSADGWGAIFTQYLAPAFDLRTIYSMLGLELRQRNARRNSSFRVDVGQWGTAPLGVEKWFADELTASAAVPSGMLTVTLAAATLSSTGVLPLAGTTSATLAAATLSAAGTLPIVGTSAVTLGAATLAATGALANAGALTATLDAVTLAATGGVLVQGTLSVTLGAATASSAGTVSLAGAVSATLGAATLIAAGTLPLVGAASATLADATLSAAGSNGATGALTATLADATLSSTGAVALAATTSATLAAATLSAAGGIALAGTVTQTLAAATLSSTGGVALAGTLSQTLGAATLSATGTSGANGSLSATLADATLSSAGTLALAGASTSTLAAATLAATGVLPLAGTLSATLGAATLAAAGEGTQNAGTLAVTLGAATLSAAGTVALTGTVSATLQSATLAATGRADIAGTLGVTLGDLVLTAAGSMPRVGVLAVTLGDATLAATGSAEADVAYPLRGMSQGHPLRGSAQTWPLYGRSQAAELADPQTYPLQGEQQP